MDTVLAAADTVPSSNPEDPQRIRGAELEPRGGPALLEAEEQRRQILQRDPAGVRHRPARSFRRPARVLLRRRLGIARAPRRPGAPRPPGRAGRTPGESAWTSARARSSASRSRVGSSSAALALCSASARAPDCSAEAPATLLQLVPQPSSIGLQLHQLAAKRIRLVTLALQPRLGLPARFGGGGLLGGEAVRPAPPPRAPATGSPPRSWRSLRSPRRAPRGAPPAPPASAPRASAARSPRPRPAPRHRGGWSRAARPRPLRWPGPTQSPASRGRALALVEEHTLHLGAGSSAAACAVRAASASSRAASASARAGSDVRAGALGLGARGGGIGPRRRRLGARLVGVDPRGQGRRRGLACVPGSVLGERLRLRAQPLRLLHGLLRGADLLLAGARLGGDVLEERRGAGPGALRRKPVVGGGAPGARGDGEHRGGVLELGIHPVQRRGPLLRGVEQLVLAGGLGLQLRLTFEERPGVERFGLVCRGGPVGGSQSRSRVSGPVSSGRWLPPVPNMSVTGSSAGGSAASASSTAWSRVSARNGVGSTVPRCPSTIRPRRRTRRRAVSGRPFSSWRSAAPPAALHARSEKHQRRLQGGRGGERVGGRGGELDGVPGADQGAAHERDGREVVVDEEERGRHGSSVCSVAYSIAPGSTSTTTRTAAGKTSRFALQLIEQRTEQGVARRLEQQLPPALPPEPREGRRRRPEQAHPAVGAGEEHGQPVPELPGHRRPSRPGPRPRCAPPTSRLNGGQARASRHASSCSAKPSKSCSGTRATASASGL